MELRVNGTRLSCQTLGEGAPCLCLHGGPGTDSAGLRRSLAGAAASGDFMRRAEDNARRQSTAEQWAAYEALWNGSLADDESFRRAFDTIRPLYFFDKRPAADSVAARRDTRYRLAVRRFVIEHEYARYDCRSELARIACPTLVAVGRHDWICPVDQAEEIHRLIPASTLAVFEHSGHSPQVEERPAFTEALRALLARAP
jgi:proline iminopeptidase